MPNYPITFQPLSFQQAAPQLSGLEAGTSVMGANIENQMRGIQSAMMAAQLPYAGGMAQAGLANAQAQAPYVNSQTALNVASIPYVGYKFMAPMLAAQARLAQAGISNANSFRNFGQTSQGQQMLMAYPELRQAYQNAMNNSAGMINGGGFAGIPQIQPPGGQTMQFGMQPQGMQQGQIQPGTQQQSNGQQLPVPSMNAQQLPLNQQQVQRLQQLFPQSGNSDPVYQGTQDAYVKKTTPTAILQQRYYDQSAQGMLAQVAPVMPQIAQFAGIAGKGSQGVQKYAQAAGITTQNNQAYRNYRTFVDTQAPLIANEMRRSFGGQATDSEREMMTDIANPVAWDKDPQQVMSEFNALSNSLKANASAISQSPGQNFTNLRQQLSAPQTVAPQQSQQQAPQVSRMLGGRSYTKINGQWYAQ